ncbi:hypothetical protein J1G44_06220 [Cellulomonas sp. zg-ZUI199]|uniref:DUF6318 domain-containing protein n=1 Tax=Cellulomonas wangleii TaxID=2816956 RepID=A0ABX8D3Y6_9CELL|nr:MULTISPECIES: DUF6318 family protein [Cellulomonas]MBO0898921.1 hypothetical protein [Cellulomonas sp. zg-ZUI22]MBO0923792.1 hypothetical protein [Cellulomonas wangleii]MBO0924074.1 hypothetical protein [Cellulomonas wangleii]QVI62099.1 hypothetical protein KG103_17065 [Cellulomonas wangleii]
MSCTDGGAAIPTAATSATAPVLPTPSPSPTTEPSQDATTPPDRPAAMATPDADGAAAAAAYFIALYPYVYATGDTRAWDELAAPACVFCSSARDGASSIHTRGGRVEGGFITVESAEGTEIDAANWYSATVVATEAPSTEYDANGTVLEESQGGRYRFAIALTFTVDHWVVDAVDVGPVQ